MIRSICWGALSSGSDLLKCVMARAGQSRGPYHSDWLQSWPTEVHFTSTASTIPPQSAPKWDKWGPRAASISIACVKGQAICGLGRVNWISDFPTAPSMGGKHSFLTLGPGTLITSHSISQSALTTQFLMRLGTLLPSLGFSRNSCVLPINSTFSLN